MVVTAAAATLLTAFAFATGGAIDIARTGTALALVVLLVTVAFGRAAWTGNLPRPFAGTVALLLMVLLAGLAALSVSWSVLPGDSNFDTARTIAYTAIVAVGALAAQLIPSRSREFAAGLMIAALIISLYALLSRIAPGMFPASDAYGRLRMPFEYWNAVGSVAVFGLIGAIWLGTTRGLAPWPVALSYPAGGVFLLTLALSQSRGAMAAAFLTLAIWLLLAPRRLRSSWWLAAVTALTAAVIAWAYGTPALSQDAVAFAERKSDGLIFGLLCLLMIGALAAVGYASERARRRQPLPAVRRYAVGRALLVALAVSPFLMTGAIAAGTNNGLGTISNSVSDMFDADKLAPANSPDRLTQTSSLRARYWRDAFKIWADNRFHGTGADTYSVARLPYRHDTIKVRHAHGYVAQTVGDLGCLGLGIILALAVAWLVAFARVAGASARAPGHWLDGAGDKRLACLSVALVAFAFGVHSAIDWTWYVPGVAAFGLLAAGWVFGVAGRFAGGGATNDADVTTSTTGNGPQLQRVTVALLTAGVTLVGLAAAYSVYQPARAAKKINEGYSLLANGEALRALEIGRDAHKIDPTSDKPFFLSAAAHDTLRQRGEADAELARIAAIQPANPDTWIRLAAYRLNTLDDPQAAIKALQPLFFVSPNNERGQVLLAQATEALRTKLLREAFEAERKRLKREIARIRRKAAAAGLTTPNNGR